MHFLYRPESQIPHPHFLREHLGPTVVDDPISHGVVDDRRRPPVDDGGMDFPQRGFLVRRLAIHGCVRHGIPHAAGICAVVDGGTNGLVKSRQTPDVLRSIGK